MIAILCATGTLSVSAQNAVSTVEISPADAEAEVGQKIRFTAAGKDQSGKVVQSIAQIWFAAPPDLAGADDTGTVTVYQPGVVIVGAVIAGKTGFARLTVKPARVSKIEIHPLGSPVSVGSAIELSATARSILGDPRSNVALKWQSSDSSVASVDSSGVVAGIKPGKTTITAETEGVSNKIEIEVVPDPVETLSIEPRSGTARTGDVVRFAAKAVLKKGSANKPHMRWSVSGPDAMIDSKGRFVAALPGSYIVSLTSGERSAVSSISVKPRNVERSIELVGRVPVKDFMAAEQWIIGDYAYLATISDRLLVYNISDPSKPQLTDTVKFDARLINDISTTPDGKIAVLTREGASNRKNGIVFLDTSDPAHPKVASEYTATVSGGVHSAFVEQNYAYITDDATGSLRVIDFSNVKAPKEVARWEVQEVVGEPFFQPFIAVSGFGNMSGRYLHDVQVKDGLAYLAYWRHGLIILDVGAGIKGGSPTKPVFVSQFRFNHHELYGDGWTAGAHAVFRYKDYVFVGDEVLPLDMDLLGKGRFKTRGIVHVIDVRDITRPEKVAEYAVPETGSHNIWVEDDLMYMGYYNGGGRVVDVSGELVGDLYGQGREVARLWTGDLQGYRTNLPLAWGAQPHRGFIYFNDINTGLWIVKLGSPKQKGSTTAPGD